MRNTRWVYKDNPLKNNKDIKELNLDKDILNLLYNRNIIEKEEIKNFLDVDVKNIADPFSLKDVDKAIDLFKLKRTMKLYGYMEIMMLMELLQFLYVFWL